MRPVEDNQASPDRRPRRPTPPGRRAGRPQRNPSDRRAGQDPPGRGQGARPGSGDRRSAGAAGHPAARERRGAAGRRAAGERRTGSAAGQPGPPDPRSGSGRPGGRPATAARRAGSGGRPAGRPANVGSGGGPSGRGDGGALADEAGVGDVLPGETLDELRETARPHAFADAARALADAVAALSEEGDAEAAVRAARAAKRAAPRAASVREALGIALYQVGDYRAARTELAAAQRISGRGDLDAMLADIERALGRPERAIAIFERSDRSSMEADTAAELLLVAASAYGDLDQPAAGVALIRRHARWPVELADHHLRLAYAEGALAEQAGDASRARAAFARVVRADPDFHDAADRLDRLAPPG
jgi:hypothetical protein